MFWFLFFVFAVLIARICDEIRLRRWNRDFERNFNKQKKYLEEQKKYQEEYISDEQVEMAILTSKFHTKNNSNKNKVIAQKSF